MGNIWVISGVVAKWMRDAGLGEALIRPLKAGVTLGVEIEFLGLCATVSLLPLRSLEEDWAC